MNIFTRTLASAALLSATIATAHAQIFWSPPALAPATASSSVDLAGARPDEQSALYIWHLRAALNVAALQCDFAPTLLTVSNYNAMIAQHKTELSNSFTTLGGYFSRTVGAGKAGQTALDQYGTRVYSSYSAGQAQKAFCHMAAIVGREAIFTPRGKFAELAFKRLPDLRRAIIGGNEQLFTNPAYNYHADMPYLSNGCWKGSSMKSKCADPWTQTPKG